MTPEDQRYYETQLDMFISEGWKHFAAQVAQMKEAADRISGIDPEEVRFKQGELANMNWTLEWPRMVKDAYEALLADEAEKDAEQKEAA
jgi:hypothetical protein